jgi:hypothetical protein
MVVLLVVLQLHQAQPQQFLTQAHLLLVALDTRQDKPQQVFQVEVVMV